MRLALMRYSGCRIRFTGVFSKYGVKRNERGYLISTVLLSDITDDFGVIVCDHLWIEISEGFEGLQRGDVLEFDASVRPYIKGYYTARRERDYCLKYPERVQKVAMA